MFRQLEVGSGWGRLVTIEFRGRPLNAIQGESVAAALLKAGITDFRETPRSRTKRGPFCLMGACFDCLVVIDGVGNQQACTTLVRAGMKVEWQKAPSTTPDPMPGSRQESQT